MFFTVCCPTLNVLLENDAMLLFVQGTKEGLYLFQGFSNGMDYWVDTEGENAIWYTSYGSTYHWMISSIEHLGSDTTSIYSSSNFLEKECPNNEGCVWNMYYYDGSSFIATNDVYIKCENEDDFCTSQNPCGTDQGDCDTHDECQDSLVCGSNNCPDYLGVDFEFDCCYAPSVGDEHFCTPMECGNPSWKGDGYCDDENNFEACEWDGGDCCGSNVNTDYCSACECLDPNAAGSRRKQTLNETTFNSEKKQMEIKVDKNSNLLKYSRLNEKLDKVDQENEKLLLNPIQRKLYDEEILRNNHLSSKHFLYHRRRSEAQKSSKSSNSILRKTSAKTQGLFELRNSYKASSKYGLTVILNPNEPEYTDALKNNYIGFKTLVHTPYNFAEVDAVGMAIGKNIKATVGIRGHHSWITEAANALGLYQKKCLSRSDDMKKYKEVTLEVFANYTRKGCILECHANIFFKKCGCLPYHYPDFSVVWKKNTTCNHTALQCMSKLVGKNDISLNILCMLCNQ